MSDIKRALEEKKQRLEELKRRREDRNKVETAAPKRADHTDGNLGSTSEKLQFFSQGGSGQISAKSLLDDVNQLISSSKVATPAPPDKGAPTQQQTVSASARAVQLSSPAQPVVAVDIEPYRPETYEKECQAGGEEKQQAALHAEIAAEERQQMEDEMRERKRREREQQEQEAKIREQLEAEERKRKELTPAQKKKIMEAPEFVDFFKRSAVLVERAMSLNDKYDLTIDYANQRRKMDNSKGNKILTRASVFLDKNRSYNRPVTSIDWNPQFQELALASYAAREDVHSLDPDGLVLVWNAHMSTRPEYTFYSQSAVLTAIFHPGSPQLIIGGTSTGQVLIWDTRDKNTPVNRTNLTEGHSFPVYALACIPAVNTLHHIISVSTDGHLSVWNDNDLVKPTVALDLKYTEKKDLQDKSKADKKTDVQTTCFAFPGRDTQNVILGSDEGWLYRARLYDDAGIFSGVEAHNAPITAVRFHPVFRSSRDTNDLYLTSSFDWTVKLWSSKIETRPLFTFDTAEDYVHDVQWNPRNPAQFASATGAGFIEFWDLNRDTEVPSERIKVIPSAADGKESDARDRAVSRLKFNVDGSVLAAGSSDGSVTFFEVTTDAPKEEENTAFYDRIRRVIDSGGNTASNTGGVTRSMSFLPGAMSPLSVSQDPAESPTNAASGASAPSTDA